MIPAVVIMILTAAISVVPQALHLPHRGRLPLIQVIEETGVCFLAVVFPADPHLQCLVEQVLLGRHDIHNVPECLWRMVGGVHMHMNSAGTVHFCSSRTELPDNFLNGFDIAVLADRGDYLYRILAPRGSAVSVFAAN